jgi:hypothetical protein
MPIGLRALDEQQRRMPEDAEGAGRMKRGAARARR